MLNWVAYVKALSFVLFWCKVQFLLVDVINRIAIKVFRPFIRHKQRPPSTTDFEDIRAFVGRANAAYLFGETVEGNSIIFIWKIAIQCQKPIRLVVTFARKVFSRPHIPSLLTHYNQFSNSMQDLNTVEFHLKLTVKVAVDRTHECASLRSSAVSRVSQRQLSTS